MHQSNKPQLLGLLPEKVSGVFCLVLHVTAYLMVPSWLESIELPLQSFPQGEPLSMSFYLMVERIRRIKQ